MPGLFGVIGKTERVAAQDLHAMARRMADTMRRLPWQRAELWGRGNYCGGRVDSGVLNPDGQPFATADSRRHVWLDGECRLSQHAKGEPLSADALTSLVDEPRTALAHADGAFALAVWQAGELCSPQTDWVSGRSTMRRRPTGLPTRRKSRRCSPFTTTCPRSMKSRCVNTSRSTTCWETGRGGQASP